MTDKYQEKYVDQLKASAAKALGNIPAGGEAVAVGAREQLYNWLITMDERVRDPGKVIADTHADIAASAFEAGLGVLIADPKGNTAAMAVRDAFVALDDEAQLNLMRYVLAEMLRKSGISAALVSRNTPTAFWETTGFHFDAEVSTVFAKVGGKPGQPIGFDNGTSYVGTQGSKTLWLREFGMSIVFPYSPAFDISRDVSLVKTVLPDSLLDKAQLAQIDEILGWFNADTKEYTDAVDEDSRKKVASKIQDTVKLARLRIPQFNKLLDIKAESHPELGADFGNVNPVEFLRACSEWFNLKRDDAMAASTVEGTTLLIRDQAGTLLRTVMAKLSACVPTQGKEPVSEDTTRALVEACAAYPQIREAVNASPDLVKQLEVALVELQKLVV